MMTPDPIAVESFPNYLVSQADWFAKKPTNTTMATELGWVKSDVPCNPFLGEEWLYMGKRTDKYNVNMYFTPALGDIPGVVSAIDVDYYGYYEEDLEGIYFSEEKMSMDGTYHSLAVGFKDPEMYDVCDPMTTVMPSEKYIAIAPEMINEEVPVVETSTKLTTDWFEGACLNRMGYHWIKDAETGPDLQYKASTTTPIVPMYSPATGDIAGIFFLATSVKQTLTQTCLNEALAALSSQTSLPTCFAEEQNWWDFAIPGLSLQNTGRYYMCSNLCSSECQFTGSGDGDDPGYFTTMHWAFEEPSSLVCPEIPAGRPGFCRSGSYPTLV